MLLYFRNISVCSLLTATVLLAVGGCTLPWESDDIFLDVPPVNLARARQDAVVVLHQAAEDDLASNRFVAIEAIPAALGKKGSPICKQALGDPSPEVRIAAALGIGDLRYAGAKEKLLAMAKYKTAGAERDARAYCAVIYALHQLGDESYTTELGSLLFDREKEVKATAAIVMGKMKLKAAILPLKSALADERDHDLKLELTRALARCGEKSSLRRLEAHTRDQFVDEQIIAVNTMLELRSPMCRAIFSSLFANDKSPRVKTVAAGGLASLRHETSELFLYCVKAALEPETVMVEALDAGAKPTEKQITFLQSLATTAVGNFKHPQALDVVGKLLKSPRVAVRVAAAAAMIKALPKLRGNPIIINKKVQAGSKIQPKPVVNRPKLHTACAKD